MASVTVRLSEEQIAWLRSGGRSLSEGLRDPIDRAIREDGYRQAEAVLAAEPLSSEDDWGHLEGFMANARPDTG